MSSFSKKMKSIKICQVHLIPPEYMIMLLVLVYLIVKFILFLINAFSNDQTESVIINKEIKYLKILNFFFRQLINSILFVYYDNLIYLFNSIITIKFNFFNILQWIVLVIRAFIGILPLYYYWYLEKWNKTLNELEETKIKKELFLEKKILKKSIMISKENDQNIVCEKSKILKISNNEENNLVLISESKKKCKINFFRYYSRIQNQFTL